ncbi:MAG: 4Fe-4S dicluster domain-containing protein [Bdellovibrionota bacterium]
MDDHNKTLERRTILKALLSSLFFLTPVIAIATKRKKNGKRRFLRPPGALPESDFLRQCIGCFKCATACPNDCIEMASFEWGASNVHTPVINPRSRGCILCMRCTEVCPTGALKEISRDMDVVKREVKMGTASVDTNLCYSYFGRTCGVCYRACPLPGKAMKIGLYEQPIVDPEQCVGCGLCEQSCIHMPQAIRISPA